MGSGFQCCWWCLAHQCSHQGCCAGATGSNGPWENLASVGKCCCIGPPYLQAKVWWQPIGWRGFSAWLLQLSPLKRSLWRLAFLNRLQRDIARSMVHISLWVMFQVMFLCFSFSRRDSAPWQSSEIWPVRLGLLRLGSPCSTIFSANSTVEKLWKGGRAMARNPTCLRNYGHASKSSLAQNASFGTWPTSTQFKCASHDSVNFLNFCCALSTPDDEPQLIRQPFARSFKLQKRLNSWEKFELENSEIWECPKKNIRSMVTLIRLI